MILEAFIVWLLILCSDHFGGDVYIKTSLIKRSGKNRVGGLNAVTHFSLTYHS